MTRTRERAIEAAREHQRSRVQHAEVEVGSYYNLPAALLPCLALHKQNNNYWICYCPELLWCKWNVRKPDPTRFGINVENQKTKENLLYVLSDRKEKAEVSALDGPTIILALTSFVEIPAELEESEELLFQLVLDGAQALDQKLKAVPISIEICTLAMEWLSPHTKRDFQTVDDGVKCYLQCLNKLLPANMSKARIQNFIQKREWNEGWLPKNWTESELNDETDTLRMRQFLYKNIAWQTKIVAHVVDGIHRFAAVDMVQVGFNSHLTPKEIIETNALEDINVRIRAIIPTNITKEFVRGLLKISAQSQENCARQKEHSILQFLLLTIPKLEAKCDEYEVGHLYEDDLRLDSVSRYFKIDTPNRRSLVNSDYQPPKSWQEQVQLFLTEWTRDSVEAIEEILKSSEHITMISHDGHASVQKQLKNIHSWFQRKEKFSFFPFSTNDSAISNIREYGDLFSDQRFGQKTTPVLYVVAHVLLWSRLSKGTCEAICQVLTHFSRHEIYNEVDAWVQEQRNIELFFQSVVDAVIFSYSPWKNGFFEFSERNENSAPVKNNPSSVIYACLLISAITLQAKAFSTKWNINNFTTIKQNMALVPQDFNEFLTAKQRQNNDDTALSLIDEKFHPFPNLLTFLVVAHGMHMGLSKQDKDKYKEHFKAHSKFAYDVPSLIPKDRNPFIQDKYYDGSWCVSIIGCKVDRDQDLGEMYTTRLYDFLSWFVDSAIDSFDFGKAKQLFSHGLINRYSRRFKVAPLSSAGALGLLSDTAVGLSPAPNQPAPTTLLTDLVVPNDGKQPSEGTGTGVSPSSAQGNSLVTDAQGNNQQICSWYPCRCPKAPLLPCEYNGCGKPTHHLCQLFWYEQNNVPESSSIGNYCPECDVLYRSQNPPDGNSQIIEPPFTADHGSDRESPLCLWDKEEEAQLDKIIMERENQEARQMRNTSHILALPSSGRTWSEERELVVIDLSLENTEDAGKTNENNHPKKKSKGKDSDKDDHDSQASSDSGKNPNPKPTKKNKKRKKKSKDTETNSQPKDKVPRIESPLLFEEYEFLDKLCERLHPEGHLGLCIRKIGTRPDELGEKSAKLLDKICIIERLLAKISKQKDGPIMNNGTSLDVLLQDIEQQEDAIRENRARHVTKATGGDADQSSCRSFPEEQSPTGNRFVENEAYEGEVEFENHSGFSSEQVVGQQEETVQEVTTEVAEFDNTSGFSCEQATVEEIRGIHLTTVAGENAAAVELCYDSHPPLPSLSDGSMTSSFQNFGDVFDNEDENLLWGVDGTCDLAGGLL